MLSPAAQPPGGQRGLLLPGDLERTGVPEGRARQRWEEGRWDEAGDDLKDRVGEVDEAALREDHGVAHVEDALREPVERALQLAHKTNLVIDLLVQLRLCRQQVVVQLNPERELFVLKLTPALRLLERVDLVTQS